MKDPIKVTTTLAVHPLDPAQYFRDAMAAVPAQVHVVTTDGPMGRAGLTATAFSSVTDQPATILVCVNRSGRAHEALCHHGVFAVNCLPAHCEMVSNVFAGMKGDDMEARFADGNWVKGANGMPVLADAIVSLECRCIERTDIGTHSVFFGEVQAVYRAEAEAHLLYHGRGYKSLPV